MTGNAGKNRNLSNMALPIETKTCLFSFIGGVSIYFTSFIPSLSFKTNYIWSDFWIYIILLYVIIYNGLLVVYYMKDVKMYQIAVRGGFLGITFGLGLLISFSNTTWVHFGWYITALSFFHWSEYFTTSVTNISSLTLESYLLDHSREYKIAAFGSWLEFTIEWFIFSGMKQLKVLSIIGLLMVLGGEVLRKSSMFTAHRNFNHYIQTRKAHDHELITHGVYSLFRHPAYVGWFYWSIGTQIILCNPICVIAYTIVSWRFFRERIFEEEIYLLNFFGEEYVDYQKKVKAGIPFIKGYEGNAYY